MELFLLLFFKILPLYLLIFIGYIAEKKFQINKEHIADLLIYVFGPAIVFLGTYQAGLNWQLFSLPIIFFIICTVLCFGTLPLARKVWNDGTENIVAFSAGNGNTGYFGIPVCLALLGEESLPIAIMIILGVSLSQDTAGFYVIARHEYTVQKVLKKLLRLPLLHAFFIGLAFNFFQIGLPITILETLKVMEGAYVPLGMMTIGFGLCGVQMKDFDLNLTVSTLSLKFIIWPLIFFAVITIDKMYFQLFNDLVYQVIMIQSLTPIAANTVTFAAEMHDHPEKAALIVIISTVIALVYIPVMVGWLF